MKWYYVEQGQQTGPVSDEQLTEFVRNGKITPHTLVWREGLADWQPYAQATGNIPPLNPAGATGEAVCAECKNIFPRAEMIRHGNAYICANCKPVFMQKLAEGASVLAAGELNYAGFWIRFGAKFLDLLIIGVPVMIVYFIMIIPIIMNTHGSTPPNLGFLPFLIQFAVIIINMAYQVFFLGKYGATLGKMACKIKVVMNDGGKISYGRATGRFFAEILSGIVCDIGYIIVAFDNPQKRALHDHICNTRVVYK